VCMGTSIHHEQTVRLIREENECKAIEEDTASAYGYTGTL